MTHRFLTRARHIPLRVEVQIQVPYIEQETSLNATWRIASSYRKLSNLETSYS